jgi:hypothetical protein
LTVGSFSASLYGVNSDEAVAKLQGLSPERADKVFALIEDLAELEALENAEDLRDAREALAEIKEAKTASFAKIKEPASGKPANPAAVPYEQLRRELGLDR